MAELMYTLPQPFLSRRQQVTDRRERVAIALRECARNALSFKADQMLIWGMLPNVADPEEYYLVVSHTGEGFDNGKHIVDVQKFAVSGDKFGISGCGLKSAAVLVAPYEPHIYLGLVSHCKDGIWYCGEGENHDRRWKITENGGLTDKLRTYMGKGLFERFNVHYVFRACLDRRPGMAKDRGGVCGIDYVGFAAQYTPAIFQHPQMAVSVYEMPIDTINVAPNLEYVYEGKTDKAKTWRTFRTVTKVISADQFGKLYRHQSFSLNANNVTVKLHDENRSIAVVNAEIKLDYYPGFYRPGYAQLEPLPFAWGEDKKGTPVKWADLGLISDDVLTQRNTGITGVLYMRAEGVQPKIEGKSYDRFIEDPVFAFKNVTSSGHKIMDELDLSVDGTSIDKADKAFNFKFFYGYDQPPPPARTKGSAFTPGCYANYRAPFVLASVVITKIVSLVKTRPREESVAISFDAAVSVLNGNLNEFMLTDRFSGNALVESICAAARHQNPDKMRAIKDYHDMVFPPGKDEFVPLLGPGTGKSQRPVVKAMEDDGQGNRVPVSHLNPGRNVTLYFQKEDGTYLDGPLALVKQPNTFINECGHEQYTLTIPNVMKPNDAGGWTPIPQRKWKSDYGYGCCPKRQIILKQGEQEYRIKPDVAGIPPYRQGGGGGGGDDKKDKTRKTKKARAHYSYDAPDRPEEIGRWHLGGFLMLNRANRLVKQMFIFDWTRNPSVYKHVKEFYDGLVGSAAALYKALSTGNLIDMEKQPPEREAELACYLTDGRRWLLNEGILHNAFSTPEALKLMDDTRKARGYAIGGPTTPPVQAGPAADTQQEAEAESEPDEPVSVPVVSTNGERDNATSGDVVS